MSDKHPITPPPEMVEKWVTEVWHDCTPVRVALSDLHIATQAARWGSDQELEACCEVLARELICDGKHVATDLRTVRRPKPPSLKEQAQVGLDRLVALISTKGALAMAEPIRRALEALDD